ncbi:MAG: tetratricopeptide repeat protein [Acidobacteriota bacterium]
MLAIALAALLQAGAAPEVGSKACAGCHAKIYQSYTKTGMARSSGRVGTDVYKESFAAGEFDDPALGAQFRVIAGGPAGFKMQFAREATGVRGERELGWFVGSGNVGRSYLFATDGFLFQAPVSYFSAVAKWGLSPGYAGKPLLDLARPVETACLQCHASRVQVVAGTQNRYRDAPFLEGGISCERCHGEGRRHVAARGVGGPLKTGEIVNPSKLDAARRDSVCEQCHLTGAARVARAGNGAGGYKPGELLSDHLAVFVSSVGKGGERAATDHAEQLARSGCKRGAGEKLACTSCHNPHVEPAAADRVAFYRGQCVGCHAQKPCTEKQEVRAEKRDDCAACHMPKGQSREGEHVAYTDHSIPRRAGAKATVTASGAAELKPFWPGVLNERDLAIAYAGIGMEQPDARPTALELLEKVEPRSGQDAAVLSQLAQYYDALGQGERAQALYERVLKLEPGHVAAGANVGVYWAQSGRTAEAVALWEKIAAKNPGMTSVALNLAVAQYRAGRKDAAMATLGRVLRFQPDLETARRLLGEMRAR